MAEVEERACFVAQDLSYVYDYGGRRRKEGEDIS